MCIRDSSNGPVISNITRISKPGRRVYSGVKSIPFVHNGLGISIVSTSRVGSKIITVPDNVKVVIENCSVIAEGPKCKLSTIINEGIDVNINDKEIVCVPRQKDRQSLAFWGLQRNLVNNIVIGVGEGFTKKLEMNGVWYRAAVKGTNL